MKLTCSCLHCVSCAPTGLHRTLIAGVDTTFYGHQKIVTACYFLFSYPTITPLYSTLVFSKLCSTCFRNFGNEKGIGTGLHVCHQVSQKFVFRTTLECLRIPFLVKCIRLFSLFLEYRTFQVPKWKWKYFSNRTTVPLLLEHCGDGFQVRDIVHLQECSRSLQDNGLNVNNYIYADVVLHCLPVATWWTVEQRTINSIGQDVMMIPCAWSFWYLHLVLPLPTHNSHVRWTGLMHSVQWLQPR